jgi:hypothetical protein
LSRSCNALPSWGLFFAKKILFVVLATFLQLTVKERHRLLAEKSQHPSLPGHIITHNDSIFHLVIRGFSSFLFTKDVSFSSLLLKDDFLGIAARLFALCDYVMQLLFSAGHTTVAKKCLSARTFLLTEYCQWSMWAFAIRACGLFFPPYRHTLHQLL